MKVQLGYAKTKMATEIQDDNMIGILQPNDVPVRLTGTDEVMRALRSPIGSPRLCEIVSKGEKVVIITSDITRPMPSKVVLPPLLDELALAGVPDEDITVVFALGSHRPHTEEEMRDQVFDRIRCIDNDMKNCVHLGNTASGTPVDVFEPVVRADRRICLGNIEYHYFAGFSGGAKAIMPGVSTHDAIQANHSQMVQEAAHAGKLEGNPVREDIDSVADILPIDFIVNVVLNEKKEIICAVAGHHIKAHREGCAFLDRLYINKIPKRADIVIVSPGGYPKDLNLYQSQKALDNSKHAVRDGGVIILTASCKEGLGSAVFERWMTAPGGVDWIAEEIGRNFELGGHKAAAIAMVMQRCDIYLVSDMDPAFVESLHFTPFSTLDEAYGAAKQKLGDDASVILMPYGGSTLPVTD